MKNFVFILLKILPTQKSLYGSHRVGLVLFLAMIASHTAYAQNKAIDIQHYRFEISLNDSNNIVVGKAGITVKVKEAGKIVSLDLTGPDDSTGKGMKVMQVSENNRDLKFMQDKDHLKIYFDDTLLLNAVKNISVNYEGIPADGLIISQNKFGDRTFFADNWPNRAHNWIPCNDHPADKASVEFIVTAPDHYKVIANGTLVEQSNLPNHLKLTHWKEDLVLPTKVMVIGVADFAIQLVAEIKNIPVTTWVFPENRDSGFAQYAISKNILPFYINYIGPYPYKKLANVQSKTKFGGMENAGNIFYYENSVMTNLPLAADYTRREALFAHEMAHQWFGDEASETDWPHVWLSEGFATYMTHLYFENTYGFDTLKRRMRVDREKVTAFYRKRRTPIVDTSSANDLLQLLNANSYEKGGWVLHMLRRKLGDLVFQQGMRSYYHMYKGKNASTDNFRQVMEKTSKQNLQTFFKEWLYTPGYPILHTEWKYASSKKLLTLKINQTQDFLFQFPLQLAIQGAHDSIIRTIDIRSKITNISIPVKFEPTSTLMDPGVNLLFEGIIEEKK